MTFHIITVLYDSYSLCSTDSWIYGEVDSISIQIQQLSTNNCLTSSVLTLKLIGASAIMPMKGLQL